MDSMRSLNRSLPKSNQPSEQLLQAFKAAAVSVTTLYREASAGQTQSRAAGYQDALDDLLAFLDKKNLGLKDGEGWLVRQWATERLEDRPSGQTGKQEQQAASESEEEKEQEKEQEKEKSPSPAQPESSPGHPTSTHRAEVLKEEQAIQQQQTLQKPPTPAPNSGTFNFESAHAYPRDVEMQSHDTTAQTIARSEASPRAMRHQSKRSGTKQGHRAISARILGAGGGSKRKFPYGEFFDISGIGDNKDSSRISAKRGRTG